jgi:DedD protein
MRTVFEEEEDLAPLDEQQDRELTLSSTTLLVIFFGLVLVCGLFFGLGYTLGRRSSPSEAERESGVTPPAAAAQTAASSVQPLDSKPKPSAAAPNAPAPAAIPAPAASDTQSTDASSDTSSQPAPPTPTVKPALPQTAETKPIARTVVAVQPATLSMQPAVTSAGTPTGIMVQIAAVSNPADADVLIRALQKHGYTVAARRQPSDTLIHVQIGPFPTRPVAIAMRQKLLGDGYNAIIK